MLNYQRVFCRNLLTSPVVCEWSVFRGQIIFEFGSSSLSLFLLVVAQIPHFDGWTFLFVWLHLHISYVFQCISNVFPMAKVMLSLELPIFPGQTPSPQALAQSSKDDDSHSYSWCRGCHISVAFAVLQTIVVTRCCGFQGWRGAS